MQHQQYYPNPYHTLVPYEGNSPMHPHDPNIGNYPYNPLFDKIVHALDKLWYFVHNLLYTHHSDIQTATPPIVKSSVDSYDYCAAIFILDITFKLNEHPLTTFRIRYERAFYGQNGNTGRNWLICHLHPPSRDHPEVFPLAIECDDIIEDDTDNKQDAFLSDFAHEVVKRVEYMRNVLVQNDWDITDSGAGM
jgi:hypothetical protein